MICNNKSKKNKGLTRKLKLRDAIKRAEPEVKELFGMVLKVIEAVEVLYDYSLLINQPDEVMNDFLSNQDYETVIKFLELHEKTNALIVSATVEQFKEEYGI